jgi:tetratricopeptide (TPR) repeat protein
MKKIVLLTVALAFTAGVPLMAQKFDYETAKIALNTYKKERDYESLKKAESLIVKVSQHPDTKDKSKTWSAKGEIYLELYRYDFNKAIEGNKETTDMSKKQSIAYLSVPTKNLITAVDAFKQAKVLDPNDYNAEQITTGFRDCNAYVQNIAISHFGQRQYSEALSLFEKSIEIAEIRGLFDTLTVNNAAISANNNKSYDRAIIHFDKLSKSGFGKGNSWLMLGRCKLEVKDTTGYEKVIEDGLTLYPQDPELLTESVNIKMRKGKSAEAIGQLDALLKARPNDSQLELVVGNVYDRMANPLDATGKSLEKPANYEELLENAALHYKKAIEIDPNNGDAYFNLGVLYFNQSVEYYTRSTSTIKDAAKYASMWEKPLPEAAKYLEKARELNPTDLNTMKALKMCYGQMGDNDKYKAISDEIKKMQGK